MPRSPSSSRISVRRPSPYASRTPRSSETTISISSVSLSRMARSRTIVLTRSASSSTIFWRSSPVSRCSCMSRIAWAWIPVRANRSISPVRASAGARDRRISRMTASRLSRAILSPSRTWARASAFRSSNSVRRRTTPRRNSTNCSTMASSGSTFGRPSTIASMMIPNDVCSWVCLYRLFSTTSGISPRRSSITILIPSRSDSSRISVIPSTTLPRTSSAIFSISLALLSWYGISVTTIALLSLLSAVSICVRARSVIEPRPSWYACAIPARPTMNPPVGKSGPGIRLASLRALTSDGSPGCSATQTMPSITSRRL